MKIGEIMPLEREITLNEGKPSLTLMVTNTGDRPVQVGAVCPLTGKKPMASIWIFLRELLSVLSRERKRKLSSLPWEAPSGSSD